MHKFVRLLIPLVTTSLVAGHARSASACGSVACAALGEVLPLDGAVDLPVNTELRVSYSGVLNPGPGASGCQSDLARVRLLPIDGPAQDLQGSIVTNPKGTHATVVVRPSETLNPNSTYQIQVQLAPGTFDACHCDEQVWTTVSTFTTGAGVDLEPPQFSGITGLAFGALRDETSDCGRYWGMSLVPAFDEPTDASPLTRFNLYVDGSLADFYLETLPGSEESPGIHVDCGSTSALFRPVVSPGEYIELRAVDMAGNESLPQEPTLVTVSCSSTATESPADSFAPVEQEESGTMAGCDISQPVSRRGRSTAWLVSGILAGAIFGRRRAWYVR